MKRGWMKVADISDPAVRAVLCRALRAHEIEYAADTHFPARRLEFQRISVEQVNLCCAKTLYSAIMANRERRQ